MNTVPALNAFALINLTNTIFIHRHCIHWTASLTWSNQVCNRIVRTGFRTFSAFFTERGVNMCPCPSNIDRTESAGLLTWLSHALLTVVCDNITGNRTFFTGCPHNLYHQIYLVHPLHFCPLPNEPAAAQFLVLYRRSNDILPLDLASIAMAIHLFPLQIFRRKPVLQLLLRFQFNFDNGCVIVAIVSLLWVWLLLSIRFFYEILPNFIKPVLCTVYSFSDHLSSKFSTQSNPSKNLNFPQKSTDFYMEKRFFSGVIENKI